MNTLFKYPGAFAYIGDFSANWTQAARDDLVNNHPELLTNGQVNRNTDLLWASVGKLEATSPFLPLLDQYHINYTWVPGTSIGADWAHTRDTWRHDLAAFAPLLFR